MNAMRLLACGEKRSQRAAQELASAGEWRALLDLCARWKVLPGLETRLAAAGVALPPKERAELGGLNSRAFVQSTLSIRAGAMAVSTLERERIPCAGFKGLATLAFLYPGPRNRTLQDVDLLVHSSDAEAAMSALEKAGFRRSFAGDWKEYLNFVKNSPGSAGNEAVSLTDERGGAVDLHWRLGTIDVETLLSDIRHVQILGRELATIGPGHSMLLTAHHALRNDFVPDDIARDVCDFAGWQSLLNRTGEWEAIRADAERWGLKRSCLALASIAAGLEDASNTEPTLPASRGDRSAARRLSALYFNQLADGALNTDVVYLTSYRPLLQVMAGAASGWKQYRESMRRSEEINEGRALPVRERLWQLAKSAARLTPSRWLQLRTLAKAKDDISRGEGR